jgi:hypothetical protein
MGGGPMAAFMIFTTFAAWSFCREELARRFCLVFAVGCVIFWNPFMASWISAQVTSPPTYWRAFWLVPLPTLVAVLVIGGTAGFGKGGPWVRGFAALLVAAAVFQLAPRQLTLSSANHVSLGFPRLQVPMRAFETAVAIGELAGAGEGVLAPSAVAQWVVTLRGHPYPLVVRPAYLPVLASYVDSEELLERIAMHRLVSGEQRPPKAVARLQAAIDAHELRVVCLTRTAAGWSDVTEGLRAAGFQNVHANADYDVWVAQ